MKFIGRSMNVPGVIFFMHSCSSIANSGLISTGVCGAIVVPAAVSHSVCRAIMC